MSNIISFETAVKLKEAGFSQPLPAIGQLWYGLIRSEGAANMLIHKSELAPGSPEYFKDSFGNRHSKESFDRFGIYAPTVDDLLKELPGWELSYAPPLKPFPDLNNTFYIRNYNYEDMALRSFYADSSVEACALAYLKLKKT